jgi:hypothetical protein
MKSIIFVLTSVLFFGAVSLAQNTQVILSEDFEGLELGPNVDEGVSGDRVWTAIPPAGWIRDDSGVPGAGTASDGVTEWAGWGFADKDWWVQTAGDQDRSLWEQGTGTVMITDPDEWDDAGHPAGEFNAFIRTAPIDLSLVVAGTAQLSFDSSWRDYAQQTGTVTVSYDGGAAVEVVLLDSEGITEYVPPENETLTAGLDNPAGAQSAVISFGMTHAGNDWWWAVDNIVVTADIRLDLAYNPTPRHLTGELTPKTILGWTPGQYVGGLSPQHRVLLSDNLEAVKDGSAVVASQDANSFDASGHFDYGTTYYWRIDEANRTSDWDVGGIWAFTTEPYSIPVETVTATASSSQADTMGPENAINGIGLNELDQHSTEGTDMWLSGMGDAAPSIQFEFDRAYKLDTLEVWNSNQLIETFVGLGAKDVTIEYSPDGADWTTLENVPQFAQASGSPTYTANTLVDFGGALAQYVKITIDTGWGMLPQFGLSEVRFSYIPTFAREPVPAVDAISADANVLLHWRAGREAVSHEVYLGTEAQDLALMATSMDNSYAANGLAYDTTYYWQITEVNEAVTPATYAGEIWSFNTPTHMTVDNFDQYDNDCLRIFFAWEDGLGHNGGTDIEGCDVPASNGNGGGSIVGNSTAPFAERTIVLAGRQSLPFSYDNAFGPSEASLTLDGQDWSAGGLQSLSLNFYGTEGNTGQLYVKINNTKVSYTGDGANISLAEWQAWVIDLSELGGNLQNVQTLTIGVDGASAAGMLYIDEIGLYP